MRNAILASLKIGKVVLMGKKVAGWAPPRASLTCVNCHNPHKPSFETRWPSVYNTKKAKERKEDLEQH